MIIIKNKILPIGKKYSAINLFGIVFTKKSSLSPITINHERIHTQQFIETLFIGFYIWYAVEYILIRMFHNKQIDAYHDVSFEEEAHNNDDNLEYLSHRKHYAWVKYIKIRSNKNG